MSTKAEKRKASGSKMTDLNIHGRPKKGIKKKGWSSNSQNRPGDTTGGSTGAKTNKEL